MPIEFGLALAAVTTAIDIQERMARFNERLVEDQQLMFRIGVHLGEVIVDEENHDLFGDGVNLAERIQAMAEPGGIAVSRAVRDVTELQVDYAFVDGGEHALKNVSRPVHIFHVRTHVGRVGRDHDSVVPLADLRSRVPIRPVSKYGFDVALDRLMAAAQGW